MVVILHLKELMGKLVQKYQSVLREDVYPILDIVDRIIPSYLILIKILGSAKYEENRTFNSNFM